MSEYIEEPDTIRNELIDNGVLIDGRMSELLPCPFCGCPYIDEYEGDYGNGVYCMNCGAMMGEPIHLEYRIDGRIAYEQAIAAWNTRAAMEFDNWFYLPKPKENIVEVSETTNAWDGTKLRTDVCYQVQEQAIAAWARELDKHIIKRICEVFKPERTCHIAYRDESHDTDAGFEHDGAYYCSECLRDLPDCVQCAWDDYQAGGYEKPIERCPNCGAKVMPDDM